MSHSAMERNLPSLPLRCPTFSKNESPLNDDGSEFCEYGEVTSHSRVGYPSDAKTSLSLPVHVFCVLVVSMSKLTAQSLTVSKMTMNSKKMSKKEHIKAQMEKRQANSVPISK